MESPFPHAGDRFNIVYGRDMLPKLTADLDDYLVVADGFIFDKYHDKLQNSYESYIVKDVEVATLEHDVVPFKDKKIVLGMGGGLAIDASKWIAEHIGAKLYSFPTVLSVNAAWCFKSAMRINEVVTYMGRIFPEALYIDFDVIEAAPHHLNIAGAADLLSCLTASYDWKLNSMVTKEKPFNQEIYDGAQYVVGMLAENIDNIVAGNDEGIFFLAEAYRWVAENAANMNHTMWESAGEHALFDTLEYTCQKGFIHGQIIGLCIYFVSLLQENQHPRAVSMLKRLGVDITLKGLGMTEEQLREGLANADSFTREHGIRYTILNAKPMTSEWIDMAVAKYKRDFDIA